jgi:peptide/nickel transport system substrate-binding protein
MSGSTMAKRHISRRFVATTAVVAVVVAAGAYFGLVNNSKAASVQKGGTLNFITNQQNFDHMDPSRVYTGRDIAFFNSYLYRNLVSYKPVAGAGGSTLVPDLATDTGIPSNGAKTWKFVLRSGITWEDGSAVTCADVKSPVPRWCPGHSCGR